jgi:twitching motility protein PilT
VITQRLLFRPDLNIRVPECEVLMATHAVRNFIRTREFFKIISALETGADHGMWTFRRYQTWLENRKNWYIPDQSDAADSEPAETLGGDFGLPPMPQRSQATTRPSALSSPGAAKGGRIEIEPVEGGIESIIKKLE